MIGFVFSDIKESAVVGILMKCRAHDSQWAERENIFSFSKNPRAMSDAIIKSTCNAVIYYCGRQNEYEMNIFRVMDV